MSRTNKHIVVLLLAAALLIGCASGPKVKPYTEMSPKEKSVFFMKVYNTEFANYQKQAADPDKLSIEKREVLRKKYDILTQMHPLILGYDMVVSAGTLPNPATEQAIMDMIDKLTDQL